MGSVRTLLAISVVIFHAFGFALVGGVLAVQLFFIISGFLISYVLVEAKTYGSIQSFYENRALRLFPIYFVVALASLVAHLLMHTVLGIPSPVIETFQMLDERGRLAVALSNVTVFGQDWVLFTALDHGTFRFTHEPNDTQVIVSQGLLVPQAWSLGVELSFYLIAPFILHRRRLIISLLALSLALRAGIISAGLGFADPWFFRFFPTELAMFLFGALSHQIWMPFAKQKGWVTRRSAIWVTGAIILYCVIYALLPGRMIHHLALMAVFILALPFLFHFQSTFRFDRKIGDLSYPIYISHILIMLPVGLVFDHMAGTPDYRGLDETLVVLSLTLMASLMLNRYVGDRIESLRDRVRSGQTTKPVGQGALAGLKLPG